MEKCLWKILIHLNRNRNMPIPIIKKTMLEINRFFISFNCPIVFGFPKPPNETAIERPIPIPAGIPKAILLNITCPYTSPSITPTIIQSIICFVNPVRSGTKASLSSFIGIRNRDNKI